MHDLNYILAVEHLCPHTLGFIPASTIQNYHLARGLWIPITTRRGRRVGFMLHGPLRPDWPLRIYQCAVEPDHRLRYAAARAVEQLQRRAADCGATEILLRCRQNLDANYFWDAIGADLVDVQPGGLDLGIPVNEYRIHVPAPRLTLPAAAPPSQKRGTDRHRSLEKPSKIAGSHA